MRVAVGENLKVAGRRRAMAPAGPMPGSTPTRVPTITPIPQKRKLMG
jgi:hypothetical protein